MPRYTVSSSKTTHSIESDKEIAELIKELFDGYPGFIKIGETYVNKAHIVEIAPEGRSRIGVPG